ncbi:membrane-bound alpha-1,6- mannosyltransferase Initiation-specific [Scheffersomyces stipitis CBS 6054]|uniref:Membrane-bound alpha-1,6-mannosyltransferase Initiation-specific n=1 Tax=Scheffersomyces stipitis (strain ATCC 58785 / CBS 6054 / NBRC 10063 / NRRL Y-11545) TaxID=322104 RepID=A3LQ00_PICST|nr:membrane-bound alpha-1,6- mannosyltransferase Initiation-specific [Scheffersomyces stipitis CBS 6054]ABN65126.2 membrane-bound alpha-1,6- mannosyltransferase Initiation-specific [Scheffersomyces stipitis CBS 6054]KAG2736170.1 hypothetical protein G9P44_000260 [Scheffersomyces stipitis]
MINKRVRLGLIAVLVLYLLYGFFRTFSVPGSSHRTESSSSKLQLKRELEIHSNWAKTGLNFQPNKKARLPIETTVRQQLSFQFPYESSKPFQKNIWQTWKVALDDDSFPLKYRTYQSTWDDKNPGYKHYVVADDVCEELISQLYSTVPDVARAYNIMPKSILKADFFRYLILYARGGVYSDIDTVGLKPIDKWVSSNTTLYDKPINPGLVVGIEADPDRPDWAEWYARRIQFCQWTIQAKKGHPMLRELIAEITEKTLTRARKGQLKKVLGKDEGGDIMNWTGPGIWTDAIFNYMNNVLQSPENFQKKKYDEIITWKIFTGMESAIAIDDVLVLPITSFSPDVGQMGAKNMNDPMAYAKHMFSGSWKHDEITKPNVN